MVTVQTFASLLDKTWQQSKAMTYVRGPAEKKWEQLVLVADPTLRVRGMHAMLDRERARIESAFVEAGLIDVVDEVQKHVSQYTHNNSLEFHTILHRHTPLSLHALLEGTWNVLRGTVTIQNLPRYCKHLEDIDADTTYVSGWLEHPLGQFQRRVLCKQYVSEVDGRTQCIIVCRSIEDDELSPYDASLPHANEVSWTFMEANPSGGTTVKYFQKLRPSAWTASTPMSSHWADRLEEHSQKVRHAVHQYLDHFGATRPPQR
ncbi:hypothetical protein SPRG_01192 [Saprolegnia parasitica CBS 223.65]|uniref:START domain-containing protein n=1 Tax=Saprolegnia parasitica (strain CBS 223.65) TaxID=695850 RepID=A0A067D0W0_SAPPC|nr:hypothetical protein SPRG_01192 [Saprolegnia parasitica CBS 223.65]KDO35125.1 hypothetical protein SPRG_01192 [Saprolegnia parasitica CBS 223.65]|eukprot:XP_012194774.1 hypothetical protein SPRG_01192 [Saprolegnia parasitica CBS 223.65]